MLKIKRKHLTNCRNKELKHVMAELQYRQKKMEEEEFYKPLEKKAL